MFCVNVRLKFGINGDSSKELDSLSSSTIVNGPFGDYVRFPHEDRMYFSWYPVSRHGMIVDNDDNDQGNNIPAEWYAIANGTIPPDLEKMQLEAHQSKFNELFPGINFKFKSPHLVGGFILANGDSDVDHKESAIHERSDEPIIHDDGYFSISTQKYTSAPYHAYLLEQRYLIGNNKNDTTTTTTTTTRAYER